MAIPAALMTRFNACYEELPAAEFYNSAEYHNFTIALTRNKVSFLTKIVKPKRAGRKFVVVLLKSLKDPDVIGC